MISGVGGGKIMIRSARLGDAPALADMYRYYVERFPYSFEYTAPDAAEFERRIAETQRFFPFLVCERDAKVLGYAYAHFYHPRKAYQWVCETSVYTRHDCMQRGVARALYDVLLPALKWQGFAKAFAILGCPNEGSEAFHRKLGFSLLATFPDMGYKMAQWHDVKYFVRALNPVTDYMPPPRPYEDVSTG
ncbi:MAG: GNAT family N-acetyltransferase [Oscillospiraceae bacterium]|jgi:phosphinothricin acetyltransferase|nr:GNAT family N-acetyltransferase [Oscillospiraceae bacterium]